MKMCAEELRFLQRLRLQEEQIWPDSADTGTPLRPVNKTILRAAVKELREFMVDKWHDDQPRQWSETYRIPIEYDGGNINGVEVHLLYCSMRGKEFISSHEKRATWSKE